MSQVLHLLGIFMQSFHVTVATALCFFYTPLAMSCFRLVVIELCDP